MPTTHHASGLGTPAFIAPIMVPIKNKKMEFIEANNLSHASSANVGKRTPVREAHVSLAVRRQNVSEEELCLVLLRVQEDETWFNINVKDTYAIARNSEGPNLIPLILS